MRSATDVPRGSQPSLHGGSREALEISRLREPSRPWRHAPAHFSAPEPGILRAEPGRRLALPNGVTVMTSVRVDEALSRLKGLFLEVPTTTLSVEHACRLTGLDDATCLALLLALEQGHFLRRSRAGRFELNAAPLHEEL